VIGKIVDENHVVDAAAGRVMRIYADLPLRLARCRTPFELYLEQCLVGPRVLAALRPDPA
jgi:hypothetical protein